MKREIITTADGSKTIKIVDWNEQYHSVHGAIAEALHVYISAGLTYLHQQFPDLDQINLLEIGLGTGLNAYLSTVATKNSPKEVNYTAVEAYPVNEEEYSSLNYAELYGKDPELFLKIHKSPWFKMTSITENFNLTKQQRLFSEIDFHGEFNLIYFDAFGPRVQPELWSEAIFSKMYTALKPNGILVTYSCKGDVRRAMLAAGFKVEKIPGPPGKREMVRALKLL